jgi:hypothetical protein
MIVLSTIEIRTGAVYSPPGYTRFPQIYQTCYYAYPLMTHVARFSSRENWTAANSGIIISYSNATSRRRWPAPSCARREVRQGSYHIIWRRTRIRRTLCPRRLHELSAWLIRRWFRCNQTGDFFVRLVTYINHVKTEQQPKKESWNFQLTKITSGCTRVNTNCH